MREGAVLACRDDRRKRRILRAELKHPPVGGEHHVALRSPHQVLLEEPLVDLVRQPRRLCDRRELGIVLVAPQPLHQPALRHQLDPLGSELGQPPQVLDAGASIVVADPAAQALGGVRDQAALDHDTLELRRDLASGPFPVAEVGEEQALLVADHHQATGSGEAGQPAHVGCGLASRLAGRDEIAHQELVELLLGQECHEPLRAVAAAHLSSSTFNISSASR